MRKRRMPRGMSLVSVAVSIAILAVAVGVLVNSFGTQFLSRSRTDLRSKGYQLLSSLALELQQRDFSDLLEMCETRDIFDSAKPGKCVSSGALRSLASQAPLPPTTEPQVDVRLTFEGVASADGQACVELNRCEWKSDNHLLEMTLTGYFKDPKPEKPALQRAIVVRRVRW